MLNKNVRTSTLLLLLVFAGSSYAEPDLPASVDSISADQLPTNPRSMEDLLSTVPNILPTDIRRVPATVTLLDQTHIRASGARNLDELLDIYVPGFDFIKNELVAVRGITSDRSNKMLMLVNGRQVDSSSIDGSGLLSSGLVDRFEVLRGPQGSIYGVGPTSGIVNIVPSDKFDGYDLNQSWLLNDLMRGLSPYNFALESNEKCDATNGSEGPAWTFFNDYDFGMPKISDDGERFYWGSTTKGFSAGTLFVPSTPAEEDLLRDPFTGVPYTFTKFDGLVERINNDPTATVQDKRDYIAGMMLGAAFGGPAVVSDQAAEFGMFIPDAIFKEFKDWSATRTDADRALATSSLFGAAGLGPTDAEATAPTLPASTTPDTTAPATSTATTVTTPKVPGPFDEYSYPPDYAFDFTQCTPEQKTKVLTLIFERDQARANNSYYMDYLRRAGQSEEMEKEDMANAANALKVRDAKNKELKEYWQSCINPAPATATAPAPATTTAGEQESSAAEPILGDLKVGYQMSQNWNLEFHIDYRDDDGEVPDIVVDSYRHDYGLEFKLPFTASAFRDIELDAGSGSSRATLDDNGVATFKDALTIPSRIRLQFDLSAETDGGVSFGGSFRADAPPESDRSDNLRDTDWQIFADYDFGGFRGGPTIGLKYKYEPVDSVYLEFIPDWDSTPQDDSTVISPTITPELRVNFDYLYERASRPFSIGGKSFTSFTIPEVVDLDWSALDYLNGQTYWANNQCGDSALPSEGGGYLTAEQSPIKSVDDQWAFERVGLTGEEPTLDEFAKPVIVGVIDTGIDWNHLDFSWDNLWQNPGEIPGNGIDDDNNGFVDDIIGWNFTSENNRPWDNDGHGTFVAGIIAATQGNDAGINGISSHAKIMVLKALNNFGRTRATYVAQAIVYGADNGAQIINLSVTGPGFPKIVQDAVDYAESKGVLVINAAGNRAEDIDNASLAPLQRVVTVAATDADDKRAAFSNVGNAVDIAAPGVDVVSLRARSTDFMFNSAHSDYVKRDAFLGEDDRYYRSTGTSFAAPIVSGIASLVLSNNPGLTPQELKRVLEQSARDVETPGRDRFTGYGIVDVRRALAADPSFFIYAEIPSIRLTEFNGQSFVEVIGLADADKFVSARLEIGAGESPEAWMEAGSPLLQSVQDGVLGSIPVEQLAGADAWTIRLTVEHQNRETRVAHFIIDLRHWDARRNDL